jgi:hypothetical protein
MAVQYVFWCAQHCYGVIRCLSGHSERPWSYIMNVIQLLSRIYVVLLVCK